ncbi:4-carboxy-4-hydroxy-2-oxoadipate aldolase/oxaloacetate decarboxylase [Aquiflexum sp. TKW24L]|uniref:4-carboxy-4-hydroxy-2-oxoadipate aldolase/oxaloacetate decarboxylase n=1 Tax=Cyclobacteriaceae TaxID=563798 RepID=UPI001F12F21A|nr:MULTISPECIES: 4-carboxy-4-hydroxy-2-oxoadipate aldolase/oxaloacetate decarboxylase [Cyclobacteriaceae]MCH6236381.1 4-carboxy-4-hydroxy-2-oxoadipate aldolase/oxaloacetate decarboxylase [Cognataquiflexum rubidum]MCL6258090.1 4-carboxy-4-hydroxy-2-oxoadipate aldolase/oxaloacetate decarboxylase [Aquiflexum sp. TKW24L]
MNKIEELCKFSSATIHEAMGRNGNLPSGIKPIHSKMKVYGRAYTVMTMPRDNVLLHRAYAYAKPGDVIVASCCGFYEAGYWGDLMSLGAKTKGIAGLVIDGCVRDADDIEAMGFPVFSRGLCIRGTSNHGDGTLNEPIIIGDCMIHPGDIIIGDRDGVVVVPQDRMDEAIEKSRAREEKEEKVRKQLREGKTSIQIYGWDKKFGY